MAPATRLVPAEEAMIPVVSVHPVELGDIRDRELVERIANGDEEAFRALFRRYAPTALALAGGMLRESHLAEETVQEAFLSLWANASSYDERLGSVKAWLMSTVHHRAVDAVRREEAQRRRAESSAQEVPTISDDPGDAVVEEIDLRQQRAEVREALGALPPEQRRVVELMYFNGMSQTRIADLLGVPLGTVKSRTLLAMRRLRAVLPGVER
jgi:RNA polymerase sigma-70 factor (ECF subfamily)